LKGVQAVSNEDAGWDDGGVYARLIGWFPKTYRKKAQSALGIKNNLIVVICCRLFVACDQVFVDKWVVKY
jgi:hypothetical protein